MFKEEITQYCPMCEKWARKYEELKAENERLQEEREKAKNYNLEYGQLLIKATNKNNKLSKTLAEIKEIAREYIEIYFPDYYDEGTENDVVTEFANKILQKINEVEDVENN